MGLRLRMALLAVLTLALVATGWAHRAPAPVDPAVLAFMSATGASEADICGDPGDAGRHADPLCQACRISGSADVPAQVALAGVVEFAKISAAGLPGVAEPVARVLDLSHAPQGPPAA